MATAPMTEEQILARPWYAKQSTWALVLGLAGTVCGFIPAVNVASAPLLAVAGLLGFKGISDQQTRTETIAASNAAKLATKDC
jgi:hypothetical protein